MHVQSIAYKTSGYGKGPQLAPQLEGFEMSQESVRKPDFLAEGSESLPSLQGQHALPEVVRAESGLVSADNYGGRKTLSLLQIAENISKLDESLSSGHQSAEKCIAEVLQNSRDLEASAPKAKPRGSASFFRYAAEVRKSTPVMRGESAKAHTARTRELAKTSWTVPFLQALETQVMSHE